MALIVLKNRYTVKIKKLNCQKSKQKNNTTKDNMVRKLKFHEEKLLKKVDFINWKADNNIHEVKVIRQFHIRKREDYTK